MTDETRPPGSEEDNNKLGRKQFLRLALASAALPALVGATTADATAEPLPRSFVPTPACDTGDNPTPPQMEGPYFKPNSPSRVSLIEPGVTGTVLTISGRVYSRSCRAIGNALLDFWQADIRGAYDNRGYKLRGHQYTDAQGNYKLTTIVPGLYTGRTRHMHVKVQAPYQRILTSQLYFPGDPGNGRDPLYDPRLLMVITSGPNGSKDARFDFVLNIA